MPPTLVGKAHPKGDHTEPGIHLNWVNVIAFPFIAVLDLGFSHFNLISPAAFLVC